MKIKRQFYLFSSGAPYLHVAPSRTPVASHNEVGDQPMRCRDEGEGERIKVAICRRIPGPLRVAPASISSPSTMIRVRSLIVKTTNSIWGCRGMGRHFDGLSQLLVLELITYPWR
ncbi:hypothetical protein GWI33_011384 [Rhynchophorus ferrugineus]|uniref:Uncharacterized protein n=1 Tax=Rhynchophorus ferrugineus TaxID=354439 RepID=A0A834MN81_RHYFE|nr:hypothetical protein GWI33_011384 [Rhynchophorus ferrugineus]